MLKHTLKCVLLFAISIWQSVTEATAVAGAQSTNPTASPLTTKRRASDLLRTLHSQGSSSRLTVSSGDAETSSGAEMDERRLQEDYKKALAEKQVMRSLPVLKKIPEDRDNDDINMILDLVKGVKFFEDLSLDVRFSVCRVMTTAPLGEIRWLRQ